MYSSVRFCIYSSTWYPQELRLQVFCCQLLAIILAVFKNWPSKRSCYGPLILLSDPCVLCYAGCLLHILLKAILHYTESTYSKLKYTFLTSMLSLNYMYISGTPILRQCPPPFDLMYSCYSRIQPLTGENNLAILMAGYIERLL